MNDQSTSAVERYKAAKDGRRVAQESMGICWKLLLESAPDPYCVDGAEGDFDRATQWMSLEHKMVGDEVFQRDMAVDFRPHPIKKVVGWRGLRWGMDEKTVGKIIRKYRTDRSNSWTRCDETNLPLFVPSVQTSGVVVTFPLPTSQFHEWKIDSLDAGASEVRAWFDDGRLVAVLVSAAHGAMVTTFEAKAAVAYDAAPGRSVMLFATWNDDPDLPYSPDDRLGVDYWRASSGTTVLLFQHRDEPPAVLIQSDDEAKLLLEAGNRQRIKDAEQQRRADQGKQAAIRF